MKGISVKNAKGIGDMVQYSSVPENYFRATGEKLVDVDRAWIFDHNPYVIRDYEGQLSHVQDMWNFGPMKYEWPVPAASPGDARVPTVYQSNAEIWATLWGVRPTLIRPRLYRFEDYPFHLRDKILLHADGQSHGKLGLKVIEHVINKYGGSGNLYVIGKPEDTFGLPHIKTETLWDLAQVIAQSRMLIGSDSGPSWIAACYHDVIVKKVRQRPGMDRYDTWTPLSVKNVHAHWDDRIFQIFTLDDDDVGPFQSYRRI